MKFGSYVARSQPDRVAANIRRLEEFGFESAWIGEHMIRPVNQESKYPRSSDGSLPPSLDVPFHDPLVALAYGAAVSTKIKLATGVFVVPIRNPFATARAIASLDRLSNGRFIFGIGIGWWAEEFEVVGASFKERALRTREYLELMTELWSKEDPVYEGRTVSVRNVRFSPKPIQQPHPPFVFGGMTEAAIKRAARLGDGWYGIASSLDETRDMIRKLREYEKAYDRKQPVEVSLSLRTDHSLTLDEVHRMAEMGVERTFVGTMVAGISDDELGRFHDTVFSKM
jgi:probable F420-dependent oxidoreductase